MCKLCIEIVFHLFHSHIHSVNAAYMITFKSSVTSVCNFITQRYHFEPTLQ